MFFSGASLECKKQSFFPLFSGCKVCRWTGWQGLKSSWLWLGFQRSPEKCKDQQGQAPETRTTSTATSRRTIACSPAALVLWASQNSGMHCFLLLTSGGRCLGYFQGVYPSVRADYSAFRLCLHPSIASPNLPGMQQIRHGHSISHTSNTSQALLRLS